MTPYINDFGVRQDEMNKADVGKIVRHFVDEKRPGEPAMDVRAREVPVAQRLDRVRPKLRQHLWIGRGIVPFHFPAKPPRDRNDVGQLHRAFDLRVASQNLLDQRGPGAR